MLRRGEGEEGVGFFFFFQAEDGIRDFCLSRGLGDVYKRQMLNKLDGIVVNCTGESPTLIVHNHDTPGHVAEVTSMLAKASVNIATLQLHREKRGGLAVMVIEIDQPVPDSYVKWLEKQEGIVKVTYIDRGDA
ncbi:L-serine ammonia-lyase [Clostridium cf. saccharolyticum K10] [Clostridioides difficile]|nr:L-serine ammonia-lyase [Clostridium cf. saccharolyticum K10] [Clostridioides difficile]